MSVEEMDAEEEEEEEEEDVVMVVEMEEEEEPVDEGQQEEETVADAIKHLNILQQLCQAFADGREEKKLDTFVLKVMKGSPNSRESIVKVVERSCLTVC